MTRYVARGLQRYRWMGHPLRWFFPNVVYELTTRTMQGRYLLRPSPGLRGRLVGIIARAQALYDVQVYCFVVLSNHWHLLASATCGEALALFMSYVNGNIARECGRAHDWAGPLWGRRVRPIPILDDDAARERLRYLIAQGVKEGLVASPLDWPGASAVPALVDNMTVEGTWVNRDTLRRETRRAERRGEVIDAAQHEHRIELVLTPLPVFAKLDRLALRATHQAMIDEVVAEQHRVRGNTPVLGASAVLAQDPHAAPTLSKKSAAPVCHTSSAKIRTQFRIAYAAFVSAYRAVAERLAKVFSARHAAATITTSETIAQRQPRRATMLADVATFAQLGPPGAFMRPPWFRAQPASTFGQIVRVSDG